MNKVLQNVNEQLYIKLQSSYYDQCVNIKVPQPATLINHFILQYQVNTCSSGNIWETTQGSARCYSGIQLMCKGQGWWQHGPVTMC